MPRSVYSPALEGIFSQVEVFQTGGLRVAWAELERGLGPWPDPCGEMGQRSLQGPVTGLYAK